MLLRIGLAVIGTWFALASFAPEAQAQIGGRATYTPHRAQFSPYFGYFQNNTTTVPNYYAYVRPGRQYQDYLIQSRYHDARAVIAENERLRLETTRIGDEVSRRLSVRTSTGIGSPSTAGSFQDYSHYYNAARPPARR